MPKQALKSQLNALRRQLSATENLDPETRELLTAVADDIDQVLEESEENPTSMRGRIEAATYRFEAEHPDLARLLGEIGDTLAKIGL
jgi:hypothetical protein